MTADREARLLIVAETLRGGLGAVVREQSGWFEAHGWRVTVASPEDEDPPVPIADHVRVAIPVSARQVGQMARATRQVRRLIRSRRPDVIHCHGLRSFVVARLASRMPPFVTLHGSGNVPSDPIGYGLVRWLGLRVTPYLAAGAFNAERERRAHWTFMAHASPRLTTLDRRPFPDAQSEPTFLWLGRLSEQKRPDIFVEAMAAAAATRPVRGLIAGDGPLTEQLERRIAELGAPVDVLGHTDDLDMLLDRAWALVVFSRFEALTFSVQEAMWAGRPVIGSPLPGMRWLIGDAGFVAGDVAAATASILRLTDHDVAVRLGEASATRIRELLSPGSPWPDVALAYQRHVAAG
jgi:glycosyltransferase involved in cell wall biosynthesis